MHNFLDAFYLSRIGIRMLIGQYLELREPPKPDHIGLVSLVSACPACRACVPACVVCLVSARLPAVRAYVRRERKGPWLRLPTH